MIATRRIRTRSHGPVPSISLHRGDIAQRGEHVGIVAAVAGERLSVWPVRWRQAGRAGDIAVTGWADCAALGNPRQAMVQAGELVDVPLAGQIRIGSISPTLLREIEVASARAVQDRRVTKRWRGDREHRRDQCAPPRIVL